MRTEILYEDREILVCHKPAGLAVQSARCVEADVESELKGYLHGGALYVVHRLDQPVEGLLVFAKSRAAAAKLGAQVQNGEMKKHYTALVCGRLPEREGRLSDELCKRPGGIGEAVTEQILSGTDVPGAKHAELTYRVTAYDNDIDVSTVAIDLQTGRFHQIRLQFAHAGHPVVGDCKYGGEAAAVCARRLGIRFVALCAAELVFRHPGTGREMTFRIAPGFLKNQESSQ